ncbi:MAG: protein kinase [Planctomyces sp.]|nr:protein kinase [Planctomyces sp.]
MNTNVRQTFPPLETLAQNVLSSGLLMADDWTNAVAATHGDPKLVINQLISKGLLTQFQLDALSEGRGASLRVGNYDILDRLGAGGMGTVFKARHRRMKRVVALKVLAANLSKDAMFVKRFQREVETIASLGHPNIVMAYDADEAEVGHFLVMEFVNGRDLAACVAALGAMSAGQAVNCVLQVARGLAYAHSQEIIHRDIKPHNLLIDDSGVVKVTDLGLARLNHGAEGADAATDVTMAGGVLGTADYMPPEQAIDSTTIDHRADIYSLGCTLHYLLTGKPPYSGPTIMSLLLKHREAEIPSLRELRPEIPQRLDALFQRMVAKRPEHRMQQMSEVVAELEVIARTVSPTERVPIHEAKAVESPPGTGVFRDTEISPQSVFDRTIMMDQNVEPTTVLIVEPSRVQASIIRNYVQEHSFSVVGTAANGRDAIELIHKLRPRAVISAMHLADTNGVELAQRIRSEIDDDAPGFVLITSETDDGESASLSKLNQVFMLRKPFSSTQLEEALHLVTGASKWQPRPNTSRGPMEKTSARQRRSELRVLIVDDSSTARVHVRRVLQGLGFSEFIEVPDGAYAIAVAARENCNLIVTDYNMPLMDGRALVSYLKQNPATSAIPIIMFTTETEPTILDPVRKLGVAAIVEKAFPPSIVGPLLDSLF